MKFILVLLTLGLSASAMAYQTGTYTCKNREKTLPPDVYKITDKDIDGTTVPYVEITRHFLADATDPGSAQRTSSVRGLATVSSINENTEFLMLGNLRLEFDNGQLFGCEQP
jgi:hypothetical protein